MFANATTQVSIQSHEPRHGGNKTDCLFNFHSLGGAMNMMAIYKPINAFKVGRQVYVPVLDMLRILLNLESRDDATTHWNQFSASCGNWIDTHTCKMHQVLELPRRRNQVVAKLNNSLVPLCWCDEQQVTNLRDIAAREKFIWQVDNVKDTKKVEDDNKTNAPPPSFVTSPVSFSGSLKDVEIQKHTGSKHTTRKTWRRIPDDERDKDWSESDADLSADQRDSDDDRDDKDQDADYKGKSDYTYHSSYSNAMLINSPSTSRKRRRTRSFTAKSTLVSSTIANTTNTSTTANTTNTARGPIIKSESTSLHCATNTSKTPDDDDESKSWTTVSSPLSDDSDTSKIDKPRKIQGTSCHRCKRIRQYTQLVRCTSMRSATVRGRARKCIKKFCAQCLGRTIASFTRQELDEWACPSCRGICLCGQCIIDKYSKPQMRARAQRQVQVQASEHGQDRKPSTVKMTIEQTSPSRNSTTSCSTGSESTTTPSSTTTHSLPVLASLVSLPNTQSTRSTPLANITKTVDASTPLTMPVSSASANCDASALLQFLSCQYLAPSPASASTSNSISAPASTACTFNVSTEPRPLANLSAQYLANLYLETLSRQSAFFNSQLFTSTLSSLLPFVPDPMAIQSSTISSTMTPLQTSASTQLPTVLLTDSSNDYGKQAIPLGIMDDITTEEQPLTTSSPRAISMPFFDFAQVQNEDGATHEYKISDRPMNLSDLFFQDTTSQAALDTTSTTFSPSASSTSATSPLANSSVSSSVGSSEPFVLYDFEEDYAWDCRTRKRKRNTVDRNTACAACRRTKRRCDRHRPCSNCIKNHCSCETAIQETTSGALPIPAILNE